MFKHTSSEGKKALILGGYRPNTSPSRKGGYENFSHFGRGGIGT